MKIETYLSAMTALAHSQGEVCQQIINDGRDTPLVRQLKRRQRQWEAFRAHILRMYRERDRQAEQVFELWTTERGIANDLRRQRKEKDALIEFYRKAVRELAPDDQKWFWTKEWQVKEQQVEREIAKGNVQSFDSIEDFIDSLGEGTNE